MTTNDVVSRGTLALLSDLESAGAITSTSLSLPPETTYERVVALFTYLGSASHTLRWLIGDLVCWGEGAYGDRIYEAAEATGLSPGTLQNYASVCGRVAPARRRESLSFSAHREVAFLEADEQERWLELADENCWPVKRLRELLADEGLITKREQPQWSQNSRPAGVAATVESAPAEPSGAGTRSEPPTLALIAPAEPGLGFPGVLLQLRDNAGTMVDRAKSHDLPTDRWELERDALTWALEKLAPELA